MTHTRLVGELVCEWMIFFLFLFCFLPWTWWAHLGNESKLLVSVWDNFSFPYPIGSKGGVYIIKPFVKILLVEY
jgi:hypothetical protein